MFRRDKIVQEILVKWNILYLDYKLLNYEGNRL